MNPEKERVFRDDCFLISHVFLLNVLYFSPQEEVRRGLYSSEYTLIRLYRLDALRTSCKISALTLTPSAKIPKTFNQYGLAKRTKKIRYKGFDVATCKSYLC